MNKNNQPIKCEYCGRFIDEDSDHRYVNLLLHDFYFCNDFCFNKDHEESEKEIKEYIKKLKEEKCKS